MIKSLLFKKSRVVIEGPYWHIGLNSPTGDRTIVTIIQQKDWGSLVGSFAIEKDANNSLSSYIIYDGTDGLVGSKIAEIIELSESKELTYELLDEYFANIITALG